MTEHERVLICPICESREVVSEGKTIIKEVVPTTFPVWRYGLVEEVEQPTHICRNVDQYRCMVCGEIWYLELHLGTRFPKEWERGCGEKEAKT